MILSFRSKPLARYWEKNDAAKLRPDWVRRIAILLAALDAALAPRALDLPGFGFHALKGDQAGRFALTVSRNWRITFAFAGEDAIDVDLEDYHGR